MAEVLIRIGILGCADIAVKITRAINLAPNATVYAVGSRSIQKALKFAAANGIPSDAKVYGSYEAVLDDPHVDAVYMPLPTSLHVRWAVLAAQKKKHLLVEKPVALSTAEFDAIMEACEENGVQFMDGTLWMHHPRTAQMADFLLDAQSFGQLKTIQTSFTVALDPDFLKKKIRTKPDLDALGALGDAGWYCIGGILWAANYKLPRTAIAMREPEINEAGAIFSCGASFHWEDGKVATFHCSYLANLTMDLIVTGTNGTLHVNDYVLPYQENEASFTSGSKSGFDQLYTAWAPKPVTHTVKTDLPQEAFMVMEFASLVKAIKVDKLEAENKWLAISRKTQVLIDAVKASIERGFEAVQIKE